MASVAELKKSFFAEIDKVENREDLEKLRAGRRIGLERLTDRLTNEFLNSLFMDRAPSAL